MQRFFTAKGRRGYAKRSERSSLVCGRSFVNFFPRATSEGFSFSKLIAGVETRVPRRTGQATAQATAQASGQ